jgi:hypothetical protein
VTTGPSFLVFFSVFCGGVLGIAEECWKNKKKSQKKETLGERWGDFYICGTSAMSHGRNLEKKNKKIIILLL